MVSAALDQLSRPPAIHDGLADYMQLVKGRQTLPPWTLSYRDVPCCSALWSYFSHDCMQEKDAQTRKTDGLDRQKEVGLRFNSAEYCLCKAEWCWLAHANQWYFLKLKVWDALRKWFKDFFSLLFSLDWSDTVRKPILVCWIIPPRTRTRTHAHTHTQRPTHTHRFTSSPTADVKVGIFLPFFF